MLALRGKLHCSPHWYRKKQIKMKRILEQIKEEYKHRKNVDVERFLELRQTPDSDFESTKKEEEKSVQKEHLAFGIEMLSNGTKQFKNYDKVALSGRTAFEVALINKEQRSPNDNLYIAHYLHQNVKFFSSMNLTLISFISRKLSAERYKKDQEIITKGDIGDCMYIIYKGIVEVIIEGRVGEPILIDPGKVFGETALQNSEPRNATIVARSDVECMVLHKSDYRNVIFESKNLERSNNLVFLLGMKFFKNWRGATIEKINKDFGIME